MDPTKNLIDWNSLSGELRRIGCPEWADSLETLRVERNSFQKHGNWDAWMQAWQQLPANGLLDLNATQRQDAVVVSGPANGIQPALRELLMAFHPWRKGPFEIFGLRIDTEWRSNWKWDRLANHLDFRGKKILDVGCGNGYYGWKMLASGADCVLGCDPFLLYVMQFEVFRRFAPEPQRHFVLPITDEEIPDGLEDFDLTLSMGVLYHRTSPIDHLRKLAGTLRTQGELVLETLIIDSERPEVLVPTGRYAKMRNVWFIPSLPMLRIWLERTGFDAIQILDVSRTTSEEQRKTDWMTFESLEDFLDPSDSLKTIEGYPGPLRAMITARLERS